MSTKAVSPTATLLRNSRLFSLPTPLPRPQNDLSQHIVANRISDTATLQYPIRQAIQTAPGSLKQGDWGLKRPLPQQRTAKTSTPIFRVNAVDTHEHVTDYESASDLTLTLNKILELELPVTDTPARERFANKKRISMFEKAFDNTDTRLPGHLRWKHGGPWLANMNPGEFLDYARKGVKDRKPEFLEFLRIKGLEARKAEAVAAARSTGVFEPNGDSIAQKTQLSDSELAEYIRELRKQFVEAPDSSSLTRHIAEFLDMPRREVFSQSSFERTSGTGPQHPPQMHPSAGLSYVRSEAYLNNHAILGPQRNHAPVEARVLSGAVNPKLAQTSASSKLGVAGIVLKDSRTETGRVDSVPPEDRPNIPKRDADQGRTFEEIAGRIDSLNHSIGITVKGGNRIWVEPASLRINTQGRIELEVREPDPAAVKVKTGKIPEVEQKSFWASQNEEASKAPKLDD